jgi:acyl carrier protein
MTEADRIDALVVKLLREVVPWRSTRQTIAPGASLANDLGIDSLGLVALAFRLAEELGIELGDEDEIDLANIETVADVQRMTRTLMGARAT